MKKKIINNIKNAPARAMSMTSLSDEDFPPLTATTVTGPVLEKKEKNIHTETDPAAAAGATTTTTTTTNTNNKEMKAKGNGFASAAKQIAEKLNVTVQDMKNAKDLLKKEENNVFLNTAQDLRNEPLTKKAIIYKILNNKQKKNSRK